jgi:hypothetical protein
MGKALKSGRDMSINKTKIIFPKELKLQSSISIEVTLRIQESKAKENSNGLMEGIISAIFKIAACKAMANYFGLINLGERLFTRVSL